MAHEFEISVSAKREVVFDAASAHFGSLGYRLIASDRPNALSFERGSSLGLTFSSGKRRLSVGLLEKGDKVVVRCSFEMPGFWLFSGDKAKLALEVERLRAAIEERSV